MAIEGHRSYGLRARIWVSEKPLALGSSVNRCTLEALSPWLSEGSK